MFTCVVTGSDSKMSESEQSIATTADVTNCREEFDLSLDQIESLSVRDKEESKFK